MPFVLSSQVIFSLAAVSTMAKGCIVALELPLCPGIFLENNFKYQNDHSDRFGGAF